MAAITQNDQNWSCLRFSLQAVERNRVPCSISTASVGERLAERAGNSAIILDNTVRQCLSSTAECSNEDRRSKTCLDNFPFDFIRDDSCFLDRVARHWITRIQLPSVLQKRCFPYLLTLQTSSHLLGLWCSYVPWTKKQLLSSPRLLL